MPNLKSQISNQLFFILSILSTHVNSPTVFCQLAAGALQPSASSHVFRHPWIIDVKVRGRCGAGVSRARRGLTSRPELL
jgi:hypothetical protein